MSSAWPGSSWLRRLQSSTSSFFVSLSSSCGFQNFRIPRRFTQVYTFLSFFFHQNYSGSPAHSLQPCICCALALPMLFDHWGDSLSSCFLLFSNPLLTFLLLYIFLSNVTITFSELLSNIHVSHAYVLIFVLLDSTTLF